MEEIIHNFPIGTKLEIKNFNGQDFYSICFESQEMVETPFGAIPKISFSAGDYNFDISVDTIKNTFVLNGYNFETKTWQ